MVWKRMLCMLPDQLPGPKCSSIPIVLDRLPSISKMCSQWHVQLKWLAESRLFEPQDLVSRLFGVQPLDVPQFRYCYLIWGVMLLHLLVVLPVKPAFRQAIEREATITHTHTHTMCVCVQGSPSLVCACGIRLFLQYYLHAASISFCSNISGAGISFSHLFTKT